MVSVLSWKSDLKSPEVAVVSVVLSCDKVTTAFMDNMLIRQSRVWTREQHGTLPDKGHFYFSDEKIYTSYWYSPALFASASFKGIAYIYNGVTSLNICLIYFRKYLSISMYICIFYQFLTPKWCKCFFMKDTDQLTQDSQYNGCWWPGDPRSQGISSHGIDIVILEYCSFSPRSVKYCNPWGC